MQTTGNKLLSILLILIVGSTVAAAATFENGKKYRLVANSVGAGGVCIGANHDSNIKVYYVASDELLSDDCYWFIDEQTDGRVRFTNAETNQCLTYTPGKDYTTYEGVELKTASQAGDKALWTMGTVSNCFQFTITPSEETQYLGVNSTKGMVKANKYGGADTYFKIYAEDGKEIAPPGGGTGTDPVVTTNLSAYVQKLQMNNRQLAYDTSKKFWCATLPPTSEGAITWQFETTKQGTVSVELLLDNAPVTQVGQLKQRTDYTLRVLHNGTVAASATVVFTEYPILDITHAGKIERDMVGYVWGSMRLSAAEHPKTIELTARYKSRGWTASNWAKHSMNMKLREIDAETNEELETDTTLLNLRSASSWILDAMAIDRIKMRNRICFDLWNSYSKLPYGDEEGEKTEFDNRNGTVGRFVELWDNGQYQGIFCLTDRINRKLLDLKKPKVDEATGEATPRGLLYKSSSWDYTGLTNSQIKDWEKLNGETRNTTLWCNWELAEPEDYPSLEAWQTLVNLYDIGSNTESPDFVQRVEKAFFLENMADWHLLVLALCLTDNGNKNCFISVRNVTKDNEKAKCVFTPWDMDASLGGRYDGEIYYNGTYDDISIANMRINQNQPFKGLWSKSTDYRRLMANRWVELRRGALSVETVKATMQKYVDTHLRSGAYAREQQAWPRYNQLVTDLQKEADYIGQWYQARVAKMDEYLLPYSTDISSPINDNAQPSTAVYDLQGRQVAATLDAATLPPGLYLYQGKKLVIRK